MGYHSPGYRFAHPRDLLQVTQRDSFVPSVISCAGLLRFARNDALQTPPTRNHAQQTRPSLRGAQRRSNPEGQKTLDCFASLAMTYATSPLQIFKQIAPSWVDGFDQG